MTNTGEALRLVSEILANSERYPWKTARYLSGKLRERGLTIRPEELEQAFIEHARSPDRKIRYSFFPARKTLDLLWGHVRVVNDFERLPDPALDEHAGDLEPCDLPADATWCFLSHNFRDLRTVGEIRGELIDRGYGVWMAEAEIFSGDMITHRVQEGLERSDRFAIYMTRKSLGSRWVLKEAAVAINRWRLPPVVLVDSADEPLADLFRTWVTSGWGEDLDDRVDALLIDATEEPAATMLPDLLIGAFGSLPSEKRIVVDYPDTGEATKPGFRTFETVFPVVAASER